MGPLAGLGDSILWLTWLPICMSIGASFAAQSNPLGLILAFVMFNLVNIPARLYGIKFGYEKGASFFKEVQETGIIQRYTTMATILGLVLVGGLIPQMVMVKVPLVLAVGDVKVVVQKILDGILPSLLPLLVTLLCYFFLKKGKSAIRLLLFIMVLSVIFKGLEILG